MHSPRSQPTVTAYGHSLRSQPTVTAQHMCSVHSYGRATDLNAGGGVPVLVAEVVALAVRLLGPAAAKGEVVERVFHPPYILAKKGSLWSAKHRVVHLHLHLHLQRTAVDLRSSASPWRACRHRRALVNSVGSRATVTRTALRPVPCMPYYHFDSDEEGMTASWRSSSEQSAGSATGRVNLQTNHQCTGQ